MHESSVSMGTRFGMALVAADSRVVAAVLGLFGLFQNPGGHTGIPVSEQQTWKPFFVNHFRKAKWK